MKKIFGALMLGLLSVNASAAVDVQQVGGWFESGYVTWTAAADDYNVYVASSATSSFSLIDKELVREYPGYVRADVLGLKAGDYQFKIVPVVNGQELTDEATLTTTFTATAHDRSGFAHVGMTEGIGAYQNDGTLKPNAKVLYVWADNAKTVSTEVKTGSKDSNITTCTGLQAIITAYQKGYDTTPLDIRLIGTLKKEDMDALGSSAEGLQVKGKTAYSPMPITIEGVGNDATISGFGILVRNCKGAEFRNFGIMLCMDDCLSLDTDNSNIWIHNMDFFYGNTGGDADQAKGDGTVDIKSHSKNVTVSYNHFYDSGKSSLGGMSGEQTDAWHTYHHNWFDHSDSRHPRIRVQFFHIYNNYYDGVSKYGVGMTSGGSAFVEANYFRNTKYPMLTSKQGTDAEGDGTFSGEPGGVIKAYNNTIINPRKTQYYDGHQTDGKWDAVLVESRDAEVKATCLSGGTGYNAEADKAARTTYIENHIDEPDDVPAIVRGQLGAGRMQHGDFTWTFNNVKQDENYSVIPELKTALQNYRSTLKGFYGGAAIKNGGATKPVNSGDGKGIDPEVNDTYVPTWVSGGGTGGGVAPDPEPDDDPDDPDPGKDDPQGNPDDPKPEDPNPEIPASLVLCDFADKQPSSAMVTVSGNYSTNKGSVTYQGKTYSTCVKMESATVITIRPGFDCTVTLVFDLPSKKLKLDDQTCTTDAQGLYTIDAKANTSYTLKKGDSMNLFLVVFTPNETDALELLPMDAHIQSAIFDLQGRRLQGKPQGLVIINGRKAYIR